MSENHVLRIATNKNFISAFVHMPSVITNIKIFKAVFIKRKLYLLFLIAVKIYFFKSAQFFCGNKILESATILPPPSTTAAIILEPPISIAKTLSFIIYASPPLFNPTALRYFTYKIFRIKRMTCGVRMCSVRNMFFKIKIYLFSVDNKKAERFCRVFNRSPII